MACLSPDPPHPLSSLPQLDTLILSPLTSLACMNPVSAASFPLLFLLTACAPFRLNLLFLSPLPPPTSPIRVLQSASVSLHWMTAPWGSHSSPSETGLDKSVMPLEPPRPFALSVTVIRTANQVHSKSPSFSKQPPVSEPCGSKRSGTLVPVLFSVHPKLEEGGGEE